jgi:Dolichyl-phosphate-mannose-protein mannosyltransferase
MDTTDARAAGEESVATAMGHKPALGLAMTMGLIALLVGLSLLHDYGPLWDEVSGEMRHGHAMLTALESGSLPAPGGPQRPAGAREPHLDLSDARYEYPWSHCYPLTGLMSATSCRFFWEKVDWLPVVAAHHLPALVAAAALIAALGYFLGRRLGLTVALGAAGFLVTHPRFFVHAMSNARDMPKVTFYSAAILCGYFALTRGKRRHWIGLGIAAALTFASKPDGVLIPAQLMAFVVVWKLAPHWKGIALALLAASLSYLAFAPDIWRDPVALLPERFRGMMEVGGHLGAEANEADPLSRSWFAKALLVTPEPMLALALLGLFSKRLTASARAMLVTSVVFPPSRSFIPGMRDFDGVRHVLEFTVPLAVLAGLGITMIWVFIRRRVSPGHWRWLALVALVITAFAYPVTALVQTHPNQICWFNASAGGLSGARDRGLLEATDYWGNSYWQAADWLNQHAENDSQILMGVAAHVMKAAAPLKLRPDLRVDDAALKAPDPTGPVYVVYFTRDNWYAPGIGDLDARVEAAHEITVQGAAILKIIRLPKDDEFRRPAVPPKAWGQLKAWAKENPDARFRLEALLLQVAKGERELEPAMPEVFELLPRELHEFAPSIAAEVIQRM